MTYRINEIEVTDTDPFENDVLNRKPLVDFLTKLIGGLNGPFVMALDSPWGSGKTTLVRMLKEKLEQDNFQCIYFNAWKADYVTDPLIAMVSEIDTIEFKSKDLLNEFKTKIKPASKFLNLIGRRLLVGGVKAATLKTIDLDHELEAIASGMAAETAQDILYAFQSEKNSLEKFRTQLEYAIKVITKAGKKDNLIFFIDELDRCRPSFAIELLERVKHLFDIPNIVFVLSIDKQQLEISTAAIYGAGINAPEYLRRFIDLEYGIPEEKSPAYASRLFCLLGLDSIFSKRQKNESKKDEEKYTFLHTLTDLSNIMGLSLRAREHCILRLRIVMDQVGVNDFFDPILAALFIVLRVKHQEKFKEYVYGSLAPHELMVFFRTLSTKEKLRHEIDLHAHLILANPDHYQKEIERLKAESKKNPSEEHNNGKEGYEDKVLAQIKDKKKTVSVGMRDIFELAEKIDLSSKALSGDSVTVLDTFKLP